MKTIQVLEKLRNINPKSLATTMNISTNMARKYQREPWKYDPPTTKAVTVEEVFGIPVVFWKDIKSFINESISSSDITCEVQKSK